MSTQTITICPPGIAKGAESSPRVHSNARAQHNHYGRFFQTKRKGSVKPGDVLEVMGKVLFPKEELESNAEGR